MTCSRAQCPVSSYEQAACPELDNGFGSAQNIFFWTCVPSMHGRTSSWHVSSRSSLATSLAGCRLSVEKLRTCIEFNSTCCVAHFIIQTKIGASRTSIRALNGLPAKQTKEQTSLQDQMKLKIFDRAQGVSRAVLPAFSRPSSAHSTRDAGAAQKQHHKQCALSLSPLLHSRAMRKTADWT